MVLKTTINKSILQLTTQINTKLAKRLHCKYHLKFLIFLFMSNYIKIFILQWIFPKFWDVKRREFWFCG